MPPTNAEKLALLAPQLDDFGLPPASPPGAVDAADVTVTPVGGISSTDAQAALAELDSEKEAAGTAAAAVAAHAAAGDPHTAYATNAEFDDHSARHENGGADEISIAGLDGVSAELALHLADAVDAHDAAAISNVPAGGIAATTVQAAIDELDAEKSGTAHAHTHAATTGQTATDHHAAPVAGPDADATIDAAGAAGTAGAFARSGHGHQVATDSGVASTQAFGDAASAGTSGTIQRGGHKHAMPADPVTAHAAAGDPHAGYRLESADHSHASTGAQAGQLDHGAALTGLTDDDHTQYLKEEASGGAASEVPDHTHASGAQAGDSLAPANLVLPTAAPNADGEASYDTTEELALAYDGQRARAISAGGWAPFAYPVLFAAASAFTTALALAANGGSIAIPILVPAHMLLESVSVRNTDAATARTWGWDLYRQRLNNGNGGENTLDRVAACSANETFTPGAASTRTLTAGSAPVYLAPGLYWLVIQSRHATSTFGLGSTASSAAFALNSGQTKTTTNPNGATVDFVAAAWTKVTAHYAVRLNGRVFGQTAAF